MSLFGIPYEWNIKGKVSLAFQAQQEPAEHELGFVDPVLLVCIAFAAACCVFDWMLSKPEKKRIQEKVGDYWTHLQYQGLKSLLTTAWTSSIDRLLLIVGQNPFGVKRLLITFPLQAILIYVAWWTLFTVALGTKGITIGPVYAPGISLKFTPNFALGILLFVWFFSTTCIIWEGFIQVLKRLQWTLKGVASSLGLLFVLYLIVTMLSSFALHEWIGLDEILSTLKTATAAPKVDATVQSDSPEFSQALKLIIEAGIQSGTVAVKLIILSVAFSILLSAVLGPLFAFTIIAFMSVAFRLILGKSAFFVEPIVSRILARLYESEKGAVSKIGLFIAATVKLFEEFVKRLS